MRSLAGALLLITGALMFAWAMQEPGQQIAICFVAGALMGVGFSNLIEDL